MSHRSLRVRTPGQLARCAFWLTFALVSGACSPSIDRSLENRACDARGECVAGYVCSVDLVCVRKGDALTGAPDASAGEPRDSGDDRRDADPSQGPGVHTPPPSKPPVEAGTDGSISDGAAGEGEGQGDDAGPPPMPDPNPPEAGMGGMMSPPTAGGAAGAAGAAGTAGAGGAECPAEARCAGGCVMLELDPEHCGACDVRCEAPAGGTATCVAGQCVAACPAEQAACDGRCVNLAVDRAHCGACGNACAAVGGGVVDCIAGTCELTCPEGRTACGDTCVDVARNADHCGECNVACNDEQLCEDAQCRNATPTVNVRELERLLAMYGVTLQQFAFIIGVDVRSLDGAHITQADLAQAGLTRQVLRNLGVSQQELERAGIDVGQ